MSIGALIDRIDWVVIRIENLLAVVAGTGTIVLMLVSAVDALGRHLLNAPIAVKYELTEILLMPMVVALTLSWAYRKRSHVALTLIYDALPWKARVLLSLFNSVAVAAFCVLITWYSFTKVRSAYIENLVLVGEFRWILWMCWSVVPIGFSVLCIRVFIDLARLCTGGAKKVIVNPNFEH